MNIPELHRLSGEDMQKIFPANYYSKYATHFKILEFEKIAIEEQRKKKQIHFENRKKVTLDIPGSPQKKVKINQYDNYEQTIEKNKEENKRMNKYTSLLDMKLKTSPSPKKDIIRSPTKMERDLDEKVLLRLKAIDDMEYEEETARMEKAKEKKQKQLICKFVKKSKSLNQLPKKQLNPENQGGIVDKLHQIATDTMMRNESLIFSHRNFERNSSFIANVNTALKKTHSTMKRSGLFVSKDEGKIARALSNRNHSKVYSREKQLREKRDLLTETKNIREQVNSMKLIKRYEELMKTRAHQKNLAEQID